jgi:hypothetical protein
VKARTITLLLAACACAAGLWGQPAEAGSKELIYVDLAGVLRWRTSNVEVAMLGANYCLPSASDYRAAGVVGADRKKLIEQDMTHFARMGWDALRLSFWGDWECCDKDGNLVANDHLDLLDYLIFQAKRRDMHMLLSPIVTYSSMWPGPDDPSAVGFSRFFKKEELGTNPKAIAAQVNYLKQLLNHVNPYTKLALKDEPYICFVEPINEPAHHPEDFEGSVSYINALVDAVHDAGCSKITFFNLSQDFAMAPAIAASRADGASFAWYPSGLVAGHQQRGSFLRTVEDYSPMLAPELQGRPRIVYEYDMPDVMSGYHYPAMVRTFRSVGAQFAAMFSYDMLATAPTNLGWQTHCLNMVYTPQKAASAIIASQVMRRIPRMTPVGAYPGNMRFGDFRVSYEENLSELVSADLFYYSNNTASRPPTPEKLRRIVGFGSSPVVHYEGTGLYFLDRLGDGAWRLEVYPDSLQVDDPFAPVRADRPVFRLIRRTWPMSIDLPDLGDSFKIEALDDGNGFVTASAGRSFAIRPGVYLLTNPARTAHFELPDRLPGVPYYLGIREFVCPVPVAADTSVVLHAQSEYPAGVPATFSVTVASTEAPEAVSLDIVNPDATTRSVAMRHISGYDYAATVAPGMLPKGALRFSVGVTGGGRILSFPRDSPMAHADSYGTTVVGEADPIAIFDPARDVGNLSLSRSGEWQNRTGKSVEGSRPGSTAYPLVSPTKGIPEDFTASLFIGDRVSDRGPAVAAAKSLRIRLKGLTAPSVIHLTLVEKDGAAWSAKVFATAEWKDVVIPISTLRSAKSAMLPQAYPGTWSYWLSPPPGRNAIDMTQVERLQFSLRKADFGAIASVDPAKASVAIESVALEY